jgi:hypothetical protein
MVPNSLKKILLSPGLNLSTDTIKVMLLSSSLTPNPDTHEFIGDINANEVTGTGYTAGGVTLTSKAVTQDNTTDIGKFDAADVSWTGTITARYAAIYKDTGSAATSPIIQIIDFGSNQASTAGTFLIQWHADGILKLT